MLGFLKRVVHRGEDLDDIRSHVLGERFSPDIEQPQDRQKFQLGQQQYQQPYQSAAYQPAYPPPLPEPGLETPAFEARYSESASAFGQPAQLGPVAEKTGRDYDILDRLNLMESQLSAIRSMTETINERLKNLEVKLGTRRY